MDLKISKMTWVHERNKFKIFCFFFMKKWHSSRKIAYCENFWTCFKMALLRGWHFSGWHKARPYCICLAFLLFNKAQFIEISELSSSCHIHQTALICLHSLGIAKSKQTYFQRKIDHGHCNCGCTGRTCIPSFWDLTQTFNSMHT